MGNSSTKEQRAHLPHPSSSQHDSSSHVNGSAEGGGGIYSSRQGRGSRDNLSLFLGRTVSGGGESDVSLEPRRETKVEREARKLERERIQREKDREWSMRVENIDGGYLITQGVYTGPEDYSKPVVRQLMVRCHAEKNPRKLTPDRSNDELHHSGAVSATMRIPGPSTNWWQLLEGNRFLQQMQFLQTPHNHHRYDLPPHQINHRLFAQTTHRLSHPYRHHHLHLAALRVEQRLLHP